MLAKTAEWRRRNPDNPIEYKRRHRGRLIGAEGSFTAQEWADVKRQHGYRCVRCGSFEGSLWSPVLTPDHVVPLSRGGGNTIENIQPLCAPCNRWKKAKTLDFQRKTYMPDRVWLRPPFGVGDPKEIEATPEILTPLMVAGWSQCDPPATNEEVTTNVHD